MTQGRSDNLSIGQIGLFSIEDDQDTDGLAAYASLKGVPKDKFFELRAGRGKTNSIGRSGNDKDYSTPPFSMNDVLAVYVSKPTRTKMSVDDVIIGYNGINPDTTFQVGKGKYIPIYLKIFGPIMERLGYGRAGVTIKDYVAVDACRPPKVNDCDPCDPCDPVECSEPVKETIMRLKNKRLLGMHNLGDIIDILPVDGCFTPPTPTTNVVFFCMDVCDTGDNSALSLVQAAVPGYKVVRSDRKGPISTYKVVVYDGTTPPDFEQTLPSIIKGCEACPAGYTAVTGGVVYSLSLEDEGEDESATVEGLANAVAGTAIKADGQKDGVGFYTVVLTEKLSEADLKTFVDANPTVQIKFMGTVADICENDTVTTIPWVQCGTCTATTADYIIDVPDNECGENRLADLQRFYPNLTIELEGTTGGCSTRYKTTVPTNYVCDECDPMYTNYFIPEEIPDFENNSWREVPPTGTLPTGCLCGIRFRAKISSIDPGECLIDKLQYEEDSPRIQVSAGYADWMFTENYETFDEPLTPYYLSVWKPRSHVAGYLRPWEIQSHTYFTGEEFRNGYMARILKNSESLLPEGADQVVDYEIVIDHNKYIRLSEKSHDRISFHIITYLGYESAVEDLVNMIASAAGIKPVRAIV